jgi:2-dehydro-3-deoxygalactonokinase
MRLKQNAGNAGSNSKAFENAFERACRRWLRAIPSLPIVASGMVGSREGWREAAYLDVPLNVFDLSKHLTELRASRGETIRIVPGLMRRGELVNVMRGEETQILGALAARPSDEKKEVWICLPGTHSKWARIKGSTVEDFETFMTGELYAALCKHTILRHTMKQSASFLALAFDRGVRVAETAGHLGVLSNVFSVRTFGLTRELRSEEQPDYLSGLLIGHEINAFSALCAGKSSVPVVLVGQPSLTMRYRRALKLRHFTNVTIVADATTRGLWQIAVRAGLVSEK